MRGVAAVGLALVIAGAAGCIERQGVPIGPTVSFGQRVSIGGGGVSDDVPLARMYAMARTLHLADGPDEVHNMVVARREIGREDS